MAAQPRQAETIVASSRAGEWEKRWLVRVIRRNVRGGMPAGRERRRLLASVAEELDQLKQQTSGRRTVLPGDQADFKGRSHHLKLLRESLTYPDDVNPWNTWRRRSDDIPDLRGVNLSGTDPNRLDLSDARMSGARLNDCNLNGASFVNADLRRANFWRSDLTNANLNHAKLQGSWLHESNLTLANLESAELGDAFLDACNLNLARLQGADLRGMYMWGCSYWGIKLDGGKKQSGIRIGQSDFDWINQAIEAPPPGKAFAPPEFAVTIDDLRVADFVWQISEYPERVSHMISAAASRLVLLLGRFRGQQKQILDGVLTMGLGRLGYVAMVFDFEPPRGRDLIESVSMLAGLSRFVIADLTNAQSTPLESQVLIPTLAVPFIPIIRAGGSPFSMFSALEYKYPWVRPLIEYRSGRHLETLLRSQIVPQAEQTARELDRKKMDSALKAASARSSATTCSC
jgi:uncharacterized protein YjbI with pentapeptide repeats